MIVGDVQNDIGAFGGNHRHIGSNGAYLLSTICGIIDHDVVVDNGLFEDNVAHTHVALVLGHIDPPDVSGVGGQVVDRIGLHTFGQP